MIKNSYLSATHRYTRKDLRLEQSKKVMVVQNQQDCLHLLCWRKQQLISKTLRLTHLKTFLAEWKSPIELEIINKKPIPKLHAVTSSAKPLTYSNVSTETDGVFFVSTENTNMLIRSTPNSKWRDPVVFRIVFYIQNLGFDLWPSCFDQWDCFFQI